MNPLPLLWAALIGAALSVQVALNAALRAHLGNAAWAALANTLVCTVALGALALAVRPAPPTTGALAAVPLWAWLGGALGAVYVASSTVLGPLLGAAVLTGLVVGGQMAAAMAIDHYGLLGFPQHAVTLPRLAGAALVVAGVALLGRS